MEDGTEPWGPFIYYDMFTWAGFTNWYWSAFVLNFFFLIALIKAAIRDGEGDWTIGDFYFDDAIDKNNVIP